MKRSSLILLVMTWWWILPFALRDLAGHPFLAYFSSHALYLLTLLFSLVFALGLGILDGQTGWWPRAGYWGRFALILGAYALQMAGLVTVCVLLDGRRLLQYYGGDAGGSVGLLFLPSVVLYAVLGTALGLARMAVRWIRRRLSPL